jgi:hypothetical protein
MAKQTRQDIQEDVQAYAPETVAVDNAPVSAPAKKEKAAPVWEIKDRLYTISVHSSFKTFIGITFVVL